MLKTGDRCIETINWTAQFTQKLKEINQSSYIVVGSIPERIVGLIGIPFVLLSEGFPHCALTAESELMKIENDQTRSQTFQIRALKEEISKQKSLNQVAMIAMVKEFEGKETQLKKYFFKEIQSLKEENEKIKTEKEEEIIVLEKIIIAQEAKLEALFRKNIKLNDEKSDLIKQICDK
ncbi:MAG: hypothetical protein H0T62_11180 [Parachlamydiaceae bacterium]|nr:hypothetical protein [Parachlamydiaceae bacterium]